MSGARMTKQDLTPQLLAKLSVLVIDRDKFTRGLIAGLLRQMGVGTVRQADSGRQAIALLAEARADAVVTERDLPDGDGVALVRWIRTHQSSPYPSVPIIMVTGQVHQDDVIAAREAGVTEFIVKPVTEIALRLRLKSVLLAPREFVRTEKFVGPSRRRRARESFPGEERRSR
jgi:DNA-binding response OmpR family regulator